jgi:hypothetical protein
MLCTGACAQRLSQTLQQADCPYVMFVKFPAGCWTGLGLLLLGSTAPQTLSQHYECAVPGASAQVLSRKLTVHTLH